MAKPVKFNTKPKSPKGSDTSFNFGFNALSKPEKKKYNRRIGKAGHQAGGGS